MKSNSRIAPKIVVSSILLLLMAALGTSAASAQTLHAPAKRTGPSTSDTGQNKNQKESVFHGANARRSSPEPSAYTFTHGVVAYPRSSVSGIWGINDSGKIVGGLNNMDIEVYTSDHGYELKGDKFSIVDFPGAQQTEVFAINKSSQMVGAILGADNNIHGFKLAGGVFTQLDYPGSHFTVATGINNSGEIVGIYDDPNTGNEVGYFLNGGIYTSISVPGAIYTYTEGLNNAGIIAGYYFDTNHNSHGFTWNKGTITTLDYGNGYPNTYLAGINDSGVIVGGYGSNETINSVFYPWEHGFLYVNGVFSTIDAPFGDVAATQPWGMNNKNEVVGGYVDSQGMLYGFYAKASQ